MATDILRIRNMQFYGYHGLLPEEGKLGQRFEVDVDVPGSFEGMAELEVVSVVPEASGVVNYPEVYALTERIVTQERFGLVESLADRLASAILEEFDVDAIVVRVRKPDPPVEGQFDGVEVEVRRSSAS